MSETQRWHRLVQMPLAHATLHVPHELFLNSILHNVEICQSFKILYLIVKY